MSSMFAWVRPAAIAVLVVGIPSGAIAEAPVPSFDQLATRLRVGDTVYVTDAAGREHKGTISDLSASSLALLVEKTPRDFPKANVHTIQSQQPDSLANGALIGLAVGAALATAGLIMARSRILATRRRVPSSAPWRCSAGVEQVLGL